MTQSKQTDVRVAVKEDIPAIIDIAKSAIIPAWTATYLQDRLERDDTLLLVATQSDKDCAGFHVGFAAFRQIDDIGELLQIVVASEKRHRGIGTLLLDEVFSHAAAKNLTSIFLEVRAGNTRAIALYKKQGFIHMRVRKDYYDSPVEDAIVMMRSICR